MIMINIFLWFVLYVRIYIYVITSVSVLCYFYLLGLVIFLLVSDNFLYLGACSLLLFLLCFLQWCLLNMVLIMWLMSLIWGVLCLKIILLAFLPLLWKCYTLMCFFVGHGIYVNPELFRQTRSFQPRVRVHNEACELSSELVDPIETFETSGFYFFFQYFWTGPSRN